MTYVNLLGALRDYGVDMERAASRSVSGTFAPFLHVTARRRHGLTQGQLSGASGVPLRTVQSWEGGTLPKTARALLAMADAMGCSVDEILRGSERE